MEASASVWQALSNESSDALEKVAPAVVAVHGRRRIPSSGVHWKPGIIVTAEHALERDEEITITLPGGASAAVTLAGRDPSTDIAILRTDSNTSKTGSGSAAAKEGGNAAQTSASTLALPQFADISKLKAGHWILAAACTSEGNPRASLAVIGVIGPAWRSWRGGVIDVTARLDRRLHPNFPGGPVVASDGRVLGIATSGLSRYGAVVIPVTTVDRVTAELEKKGHIGRGFLGLGMAPVRVPRRLGEALKLGQETGVLVMAVEPESPAEKAGVVLGDLLFALDGTPVRDTDDVQGALSPDRVGKSIKASIIRGGALSEIAITVGERPIRA